MEQRLGVGPGEKERGRARSRGAWGRACCSRQNQDEQVQSLSPQVSQSAKGFPEGKGAGCTSERRGMPGWMLVAGPLPTRRLL